MAGRLSIRISGRTCRHQRLLRTLRLARSCMVVCSACQVWTPYRWLTCCDCLSVGKATSQCGLCALPCRSCAGAKRTHWSCYAYFQAKPALHTVLASPLFWLTLAHPPPHPLTVPNRLQMLRLKVWTGRPCPGTTGAVRQVRRLDAMQMPRNCARLPSLSIWRLAAADSRGRQGRRWPVECQISLAPATLI